MAAQAERSIPQTRFGVRIYSDHELGSLSQEQLKILYMELQNSYLEFAACAAETSSQCESLHKYCKALEAENRKLANENRSLKAQPFCSRKNEKLELILPKKQEVALGSEENTENDRGEASAGIEATDSNVISVSGDSVFTDPGLSSDSNEKTEQEDPELAEKRAELEKRYAECREQAKAAKKELDALHPEGSKGKPIRGKNTDLFMDELPRVYDDVHVSEGTLQSVFDSEYKQFGRPGEIEELVVEPARIYVLVHRIPKYAGLRNGESYVYEPAFAIDNKLIPGSICSISLLSYFLSRKYSDGMPVTRQLNSAEMQLIDLSKQRVYGWIHFAACLFAPLVFRVLQLILAGGMIQMDETYTTFLCNGEKKTGYYWVIRSGAYDAQPLAMMIFASSRAEYVLEMIFGWMSDIHFAMDTDGHSAYGSLHDEHPEMVDAHGTCWSHARSRLVRALNDIPNKDTMTDSQLLDLPAYQLLLFIAMLFAIDMPLKNDPEKRLVARNEKSRPVVKSFFNLIHLLDSDPQLDRGSKLGEAVTYCVNQEEGLLSFLDHADIPLSNNASEQLMIWLAMGRCGWKMSSSPGGAMDNAMCYSICYLAKLAGIDPEFYFQYLLSELPGALRKLGMQRGCEYNTFLDTFVLDHMRRGADNDLPPAERKRLREEAQDKEMARKRMRKKFRKENVPDDLSPLDRLLPYSPEVREQERLFREKKLLEIAERNSTIPASTS